MSDIAYHLGRICVPIVFIVSGAQKIKNISAAAESLAAKNLPVPEIVTAWTGLPRFEALAYLAGGIEVVFGLMVIFGLFTRFAAAMLLLFTVATIYIAHDFWAMEGASAGANLTQALKNLAIMGGLLLLMAPRPSRFA